MTSPSGLRHAYSDDKHTVLLNIWYTSGQEKFQSMANLYVRNAFAVIIVLDLTCPDSYGHLENWMAMSHQSDPRPRVYFVVGNKTDLGLHRTIEYSDAER
jgi:GTPase SAR1 family protein